METDLKGKIVKFVKNGVWAVVETEDGEAYLDVNDKLGCQFRVGDEVEVDGASYYVSNGRIVTVLAERYIVNGKLYA